jgi:hypothetical protein
VFKFETALILSSFRFLEKGAKKQFGRKESKMNSDMSSVQKSRKATQKCVKNPQNVWRKTFSFTIEFATSIVVVDGGKKMK